MSNSVERPSLWELYEREKARANAAEAELAKHETCIAENGKAFDISLGECLDRAEKAEEALAAARRECEGLRLLLFLRHGCSGPALYGDDGERQCSACGIDFRRQSPEEISARWEVLARAALAAPAAGEEK